MGLSTKDEASSTNMESPKQRKKNLVHGELAELKLLEEGQNQPNTSTTLVLLKKWWKSVKFQITVARNNPLIIILAFGILAGMCTASLTVIFFMAKFQEDELETDALGLATETGNWFSSQLDLAILPLFSMVQFVSELEIFQDLPESVGPPGEAGSLPFLPPFQENGWVTHRNVSGVCDDPSILKRFNDIAATVKRNANMEGILVSIQLVPYEVVCMIHPLINREDFPHGVVMNSTGAIGLDLLTDPARRSYAESVVKSDDIIIIGPVPLRECQGADECQPLVERAFIAALPVMSSAHSIVIDGYSYPRWGSVEVIINWKALIERSSIFQRFADLGQEFQLTRTDRYIDQETQEETVEVVVLAETPNFDPSKFSTVTTYLDTTDSEWQMTIAYKNSVQVWKTWAIVISVMFSFLLCFLTATILLQKEAYQRIKTKYMEDLGQPQRVRLRLHLEDSYHGGTAAEDVSEEELSRRLNTKPIADFFSSTTMLLSDMEGFDAWSSEREPAQVFLLLQRVFFKFDQLSRQWDILNVETIGDCYVACCGIPNFHEDHAVRMVQFARACLEAFDTLTQALDLGPETNELKMRIGIASGPVTAGVLQHGTISKFHLYGTTVDCANGLLNTAKAGTVHLSPTTMELLVAAGKQDWVSPCSEITTLPGQGDLWTGVLAPPKKQQPPSSSSANSPPQDLLSLPLIVDNKSEEKLVEWQVESMVQLLKKIKGYHGANKLLASRNAVSIDTKLDKSGECVLDEVKEVIRLPEFDAVKTRKANYDLDGIQIPSAAVSQLRAFIQRVAGGYHNNPFHNFEHANHVVMAVHKFLNRIVTPEDVDYERTSTKKIEADKHNYTFGITSDPLTHFAVVFSALVHDMDHRGVSNGQLAKEIPVLGEKYRHQSVAEQNSVDLAWEMLMEPQYKDLQQCIFHDRTEFLRFRQLVVNVVLATDIFDKELKALRNLRWDKAFHPGETPEWDTDTNGGSETSITQSSVSQSLRRRSSGKINSTNRKATIVIEHIIQASDVSHTMQHWKVYKKWNERLFQEMYLAYSKGRAPKDPSLGWYKGELWFFDNYVIPLAKKLSECGVFGVASDECLIHAQENRRAWANSGEALVADMLARTERMVAKDSLTAVVKGGDEMWLDEVQ